MSFLLDSGRPCANLVMVPLVRAGWGDLAPYPRIAGDAGATGDALVLAWVLGGLLELLRAGEDGVRVDGSVIHGNGLLTHIHVDRVDNDLPVDRCDAQLERIMRPYVLRCKEIVGGEGQINPIAVAVGIVDRRDRLAVVDYLNGHPRLRAAIFESILHRPVDGARDNLEINRHISRIEIVDDLKSFLGEIEIGNGVSFVAVGATVDHPDNNRFFRACWARARDLNALAAGLAAVVITRQAWGTDHPIRKRGKAAVQSAVGVEPCGVTRNDRATKP